MTDWLWTNITDTPVDSTFGTARGDNGKAKNQIPGTYTNSFDVLVDYSRLDEPMIPWPDSKPLRVGDRVFVYRRHINKYRRHAYDGMLVGYGIAASDPCITRIIVPATGEPLDRNMVRIRIVLLPPEYRPDWDVLTAQTSPLHTVAALTSGKFAPPTRLNQEQTDYLYQRCTRNLKNHNQ